MDINHNLHINSNLFIINTHHRNNKFNSIKFIYLISISYNNNNNNNKILQYLILVQYLKLHQRQHIPYI